MSKYSIIGMAISGNMLLGVPAICATLPVSEDSSTSKAGLMDKRSGESDSLSVSEDKQAFIRFDVADFSGLIRPSDITSARLTFYFTEVAKPGEVTIHRTTSEWTESPAGVRQLPSYQAKPLATIPSKATREGQFAIVDVTEQVKLWLSSPKTDRGFAIASSGPGSLKIRAKEGSADGLPASLEIESHPMTGNSHISPGVNANKLADGSVSDREFRFLNGVTSPIQVQFGKFALNMSDLANTAQLHEARLEDLALNFSTTGAAKVNKTGDTMSGPLILPAGGLSVGDSDVVVKNGKTGVGTANPQNMLDVRGDISLGDSGEFQAAAGEEKLRIVRGIIRPTDSSAIITAGKGFTCLRTANQHYQITFDQPFSDIPTITLASGDPSQPNSAGLTAVISTSTTGAVILGNLSQTHFIAIGPR